MKTRSYGIAIIGGGIVGMATAMNLLKNKKISLVVVEKESKLAAHQTGNNSGVIHSGLYYKPGSLKAENCARGRTLMYRFCEEHQIPHERCGKVVVATREDELPKLQDLEDRGKANGLEGLKRLRPEEIKEYEPHANGIAGLLVPQTGIVDYISVTEKFRELVQKNGGEIKMNFRVEKIRYLDSQFVLESPQGEVFCQNIINCGGLQSDRIARLAGADPGLKIIPFRGEYFEIKKERHGLVKNLLYPVPDPKFPFLGVHFTRLIHGGVEAGPNAVLAFKREGYTRTSFSIPDFLELLGYAGFWKMGFKHWKMGVGEMVRSWNKHAFLKALQRLLPEIQKDDLVRGGAGVRAQALEPDGQLVDDFRILERPGMIHVLNAPSPAATASISIGATIADLALKNFV